MFFKRQALHSRRNFTYRALPGLRSARLTKQLPVSRKNARRCYRRTNLPQRDCQQVRRIPSKNGLEIKAVAVEKKSPILTKTASTTGA